MCIETTSSFLPLTYQTSELVTPAISSLSAVAEAKFYLIKLATHDHQALFGEMAAGHLRLNSLGQIAVDEWTRAINARDAIEIDQWVIYPDHLQGIVRIQPSRSGDDYLHTPSSKPRLLSSFVAGYKAAAAKRINLRRNCPGQPVWQRSYHQRPLVDEVSRQRTRQMLMQPTAV
jgi:putative transposase